MIIVSKILYSSTDSVIKNSHSPGLLVPFLFFKVAGDVRVCMIPLQCHTQLTLHRDYLHKEPYPNKMDSTANSHVCEIVSPMYTIYSG